MGLDQMGWDRTFSMGWDQMGVGCDSWGLDKGV